jgi:hypothetical protein
VTRVLTRKLGNYVVHEAHGWRRNGQDPPLTFQRLERQRCEHGHDRERFAETLDYLRRRNRKRLVMRDALPRAAVWLFVTVQTHDARRVVAWVLTASLMRQEQKR